MSRLARTPAVLLAMLALALTGCGSETPVARDEPTASATPTPVPTPTPADGELPPSYSFTFEASCFCPDTDVTYRVEVQDGAVVAAVVDTVESARTRKRVQPGDQAPDYYRLSIQDMLDSPGLDGGKPADKVDVTWPDGSDHPTRIAVDRAVDAIDDEVDYRILSFEVA